MGKPPTESAKRELLRTANLAHADSRPADSLARLHTVTSGDATLRILDAAGNRAREALRVLEDFTRFQLNDATLSRELKELRHAVAEALAPFGAQALTAARDTLGDVGTTISTESERNRTDGIDVVTANFKRGQESLRSLEEYAKCIDAESAERFEQIRYRLYILEKVMMTAIASHRRLADCRLYWLFTASACRGDALKTVADALQGGVDAVQLREKTGSDREVLQSALEIRKMTRDAQALFIVNDRPDLAVLAAADGVHVGQDELTVADVRKIVGPEMLIGVSTHNLAQARRAVEEGADYLGVGPVFPSRTKPFAEFAGLDFVRAAAANLSLPWFAIGGIDLDNIAEVTDAGATRVAVGNAISSADGPTETTRQLLSTLRLHTRPRL